MLSRLTTTYLSFSLCYNILYFVFCLQIYYCEYYEKYLEEYERRRQMMNETPGTMGYGGDNSGGLGLSAASSNAGNVEASILMDDIMNNGMTFCSIM